MAEQTRNFTSMLAGLGFWKKKDETNGEYLSGSIPGLGMTILVMKIKNIPQGSNQPTHYVRLERKVATESGEEKTIPFNLGLKMWENKYQDGTPYYSGRLNLINLSLQPTKNKNKPNSPDYYTKLSQEVLPQGPLPETPPETTLVTETTQTITNEHTELIPF